MILYQKDPDGIGRYLSSQIGPINFKTYLVMPRRFLLVFGRFIGVLFANGFVFRREDIVFEKHTY